jgi:leader peptidase (prepilin peptidase)/N-methyltransferase
MLPLVLALVGIPVGFVIDVLAVHLAAVEDRGRPGLSPVAGTSPHGESGLLLLDDRAWGWPRRLLVVVATAALFAAAAARYDQAAHLPVVCAYISILLVCAVTDLLAYRVPNAVTYPAIVGAMAVGAVSGAGFVDVVLGGILAGGVLLLPALASRGAGMGMGDVKLAAFIGLAVGLSHTPLALIAMALSGGLTAALLLVTRLRHRGDPIPYAPFVAVGGLVVLLAQGPAFADLA